MNNMKEREEFFTDQEGQMTFLKVKASVDMVNTPPHYNQGGIETIDVIRLSMTPELFKGYLIGSILKYRLRAGLKGPTDEDLEKAEKYYKLYVNEFGFREAGELWK